MAARTTGPSARIASLWPALAIVVVVLVAYHNSLRGAFVFDDVSSVFENASIRNLFAPGSVLSPPASAGVGGRPVANLTLAVSYAIGGLDPWSYHAVNLLIHTAAALTLFGAMRRTFLQPRLAEQFRDAATPLAFAIAVLWAAHPLQTAVVDYVSQRTEALMALFYLLTLYGFLRSTERRSRAWWIFTVAACALGMASKETMVTAPLGVLLFDRIFVSGSWRKAWCERGGLHLALTGTWIVLAALLIRSSVAERGVGFGLGVTPLDYAFTQSRAILHYLRLAVWPAPLVFDYGWSFIREVGEAMPFLAGCSALLIATLVALRRVPTAGFAGTWVFLTLAPTSSIVPIIQQPIAESRMYLPLAGVIALAVTLLWRLVRTHRAAMLGVFSITTVALIAATVRRNTDYATPIALWSDVIAKIPDNARAHANLAAIYLQAGRTDDAIAAAETALRLRPEYPEARNNLALALLGAGRPAEALAQLRMLVASRPDYADARYNLGETLAQTRNLPDAVAEFEAVLRSNPNHARAHNNLGVVLLQLGRPVDAIAHDRAALRLDPGSIEAHYNLGNALAQAGDIAGATSCYEAALRLDPRFAKAHHNLGVLALRSGRFDEAVARFRAALQANPDYAEARKNLAIAEAARRGN